MEINRDDNMPSFVRYYNKYFDHIDGSIYANYKRYAHMNYMCSMEDDIYYVIFTDEELDRVFNSAKVIAGSLEQQ
jgi:hypothetical protein